jgi:hypothetical protein
LVLASRFFCSPVSNAVSECRLLLDLAFVILLYLLLAPPAVPGTHADDDTKDKQDQSPASHDQCTQPPPSSEEQGESVRCSKEYEHNCADY